MLASGDGAVVGSREMTRLARGTLIACLLLGAPGPAPASAQTQIPRGRPIHVKCKTPPQWIPKLVSAQLDQDGNFVEDEIDQLPPLDPIDVILALNDCPDAGDRARFAASGGTLSYVSRTISVAHLRGVSASAAVALGQDVRVAMVFLDRQLLPFLDTSTAAIRVTQSAEYAGMNLEELAPGLDGAGVNVAVIDTGIDGGHVGLPLTKFVGGLDLTINPPDPVLQDPDDLDGHGTHVAGIIAGEGGGSGESGVAPGAGLIDVKVCDGSGGASMSVVQRAIDECILRQAEWEIGVIHVGLGCDACDSAGDDPVSETANRAVQAGIVMVAPMGNDGVQRVPSPAAADGVIAVAALDDMGTVTRSDDAVASLSNSGPRLDDGDADVSDEQKPDCSAPGIGIASAEFDTLDGYQELSGTSMAAAHVAGLAALVRQARPEWRAPEVREWILGSCEPLTGMTWEPGAGRGEIDGFGALVRVQNLGLAGQGFPFSNQVLALLVNEGQQGAVDLNGDGDAGDPVLHLLDLPSGVAQNLGLAGELHDPALIRSERLILYYGSEGLQGPSDLNGDGDTLDQFVPHVYDAQTGTLVNTALSGLGKVAGSRALVVAHEGGMPFTDYNGDGDNQDSILFLYDPDTQSLTNVGVPADTRLNADHIALFVGEVSQGGTDLNGDADATDQVVHVYDFATSSLTNLGLALVPPGANTIRIDGDHVVFSVSEAAQGNMDLNGDGDAADQVLHAYDFSTATLENLGLATVDDYFDVVGGVLAAEISEADQGSTDLNGDGDASDFVLHVHDLNLPAAGGVDLGLASLGYGGNPATDGDTVAFLVSETFQASSDLNGDGDALDAVLHLFDVASGVTINVGIAGYSDGGSGLLVEEGEVAFRVPEASQDSTDLNGDGDLDDTVLHVYHLSDGLLANVGLAVTRATRHFSAVYETYQGNTDLNGDGDVLDRVLFAHNARFGARVNLRLALSPTSSPMDERLIVVGIGESDQGSVDLNGDGDALDRVMYLVGKL